MRGLSGGGSQKNTSSCDVTKSKTCEIKNSTAHRRLRGHFMASCSLDGTHIFRFIECVTLQPFTNFLQDGGQKVSSGMAPVLMAMSTLYVAYISVKMVLGMSSAPLAEIVKTVVKIGAINMIALNFGTYMEFVATPLSNGIPNTISNWLIGSNNLGNSQFDNCVAEMMKFAAKITKEGTWFEAIKYAILLVVYLAFTLFMLGWAFILTIISKGLMYFVLALGPIFVACAMFEQTRSFLTSFVNTAVTLLIQQVLVAAVVALCLAQFNTVTATATPDFMMSIVNTCVFDSCVMFILKEVPGLAQRLGNGYGFAAGKAFDALRPASEHDSSIRGAGRSNGSQFGNNGRPGGQDSGGGNGGGGRRTETANASAPSSQGSSPSQASPSSQAPPSSQSSAKPNAAPPSVGQRIARAADAIGAAVAPSNIVGTAVRSVAAAAVSSGAGATVGSAVAETAASDRVGDRPAVSGDRMQLAVGATTAAAGAAGSNRKDGQRVESASSQAAIRQGTAAFGGVGPDSSGTFGSRQGTAASASAGSSAASVSSRQETATATQGGLSGGPRSAGADQAASASKQHDGASSSVTQTSTVSAAGSQGRAETATGDTAFQSVEIEGDAPFKRD
jgi:type IV secretion system protein VirB6